MAAKKAVREGLGMRLMVNYICSPLRGRIKGTATQINPVLPYFRGNTSIAPPQSDN